MTKANMGGIAGTVHKNHGIIQAIGKHIIAKDTLSSGSISIRVDESADFGIVIAGLEVVEPGLSVLGLTAIPV